MKYYVIYKQYTEYNQFEGSWDKDYDCFNNYEVAKSTKEHMCKSGNYTDVIGPLVLAKTPKKKEIKNYENN